MPPRDDLDEHATDPRVNDPVPPAQVPLLVARVRMAANEVRIGAEMVARQAGGGPLHDQAMTLAHHACRLAQWATMASALPPVIVPPEPPTRVELRRPDGMPRWLVVLQALEAALRG